MLEKSVTLQIKTNCLLNWYLNPKSRCLNLEPHFTKQLISDSIHSAYNSLAPEIHDGVKFEYKIKKLDRSRYDTDFLRPVLKISDIAKDLAGDYINDFILHGSLSTFDFIPGWSDFDSIAIVRDATLNDSSKMIKMRSIFFEIDRLIKKIDNHQHHGVHFITEKDLKMYPDLYLPHKLFKDSVSLLSGGNLLCSVRNSKREQIARFNSIYNTFKLSNTSGILRHHAYNGEYLMENFKNFNNGMYQLKYFLSVIVILPSYFMNIMGQQHSKTESIERCRKIISERNFKIIDKSTMIRSSWRINPVVSNVIPEEVKEILDKNYLSSGYNLIREMKEHLGI